MPDASADATVWVPATSANLGPGFDCLGLALDLVDQVSATVVDQPGVRVQVSGEGAGEVPTGEDHLVVRALRATLGELGVPMPPGLLLRATNRVPHGRGLGSSAAAVIAGVLLARTLAGVSSSDLDDDGALGLAMSFEGHPDNAAAALLGGATIAWVQDGRPRAVRVAVHPDVVPLVLLPTGRLATHHARAVLPATVSHEDAAANAGRTALLVHALSGEPGLLLPATEDRLHQSQRRSAMPATLDLVERLRADGLAAVVSGAGPAVLVLSTHRRRQSDVQVMTALTDRLNGEPATWALLTPGLRTLPACAEPEWAGPAD